MTVDLFAGMPVTDRARAIEWYDRLLGRAPEFFPNDDEAVWELAEHRYVYVIVRPADAGHAVQTAFVDDLDARVAASASRGVEPAAIEDYDNGVRKVTYRDPDGNEMSFGNRPAEEALPRSPGERGNAP